VTASNYDFNFYKDRHSETSYAATRIFSELVKIIPMPQRVLDVGCGIGTFLKIAEEMGAVEIKGIDGEWVPKDLLVIPRENFSCLDFTELKKNSQSNGFETNKSFDLCLSLEVAEHLPPDLADDFVRFLTSNSPIILFSAAIPKQGGRGHLSENFPSYWVKKFERNGYFVVDCLRSSIWTDRAIPVWYRQNLLVFIDSALITNSSKSPWHYFSNQKAPLDVVHPDIYMALKMSLKDRLARKFRRLCRSLL
jgi:SAM-dependent methyltransferase